jgi:uncharacterized protein
MESLVTLRCAMVTRIILVLVLICMTSAVRAADSQPTEASVKQLLEIMRMRKSLDLIATQMDKIMQTAVEQATQGHPLTANAKQSVARCRADVHDTIRDELNWEKMEPVYVDIYQKAFTQKEIDSLIAFYESPVGQNIVVKLPEAMKEAEEQTMELVRPMMLRIQEMAQEITKTMKPAK